MLRRNVRRQTIVEFQAIDGHLCSVLRLPRGAYREPTPPHIRTLTHQNSACTVLVQPEIAQDRSDAQSK